MRVWQMVGGILYVLVIIRLRDGVRPSGQQHLARLDWNDGPFQMWLVPMTSGKLLSVLLAAVLRRN